MVRHSFSKPIKINGVIVSCLGLALLGAMSLFYLLIYKPLMILLQIAEVIIGKL